MEKFLSIVKCGWSRRDLLPSLKQAIFKGVGGLILSPRLAGDSSRRGWALPKEMILETPFRMTLRNTAADLHGMSL
jgi:hypothetical protein